MITAHEPVVCGLSELHMNLSGCAYFVDYSGANSQENGGA